MNRNIDPSVRKEYLEWLLTPPLERLPKTKTEMAEHLGVALKTLYNWEATPDFKEEMLALKSKWGARWHGDILGRLMDIVLNGPPAQSVAASKVLLEHLDLGQVEKKADELGTEALERIRAGLKAAGYDVIENAE